MLKPFKTGLFLLLYKIMSALWQPTLYIVVFLDFSLKKIYKPQYLPQKPGIYIPLQKNSDSQKQRPEK